MNTDIMEYRRKLKKKLSEARYEHSLSVSFTCVCLAMRYGYPLDKAELAGLLHDCAKCYADSEFVHKCEKHNIILTEDEKKAPAVLHAKYGAWMAREKYGIHDEEILSAIACHTTGKPNMSLLDKILYVADYIEVRRDKASNLVEMRHLAFEDIDEAMYQIIKGTLTYLDSKGTVIDTMTQKTFDYLEKRREAHE